MTMLNFNWPQKHYILILSTMMIAMSKLTTRLFRQGLLLQGRFPISESNVSNPLHYRYKISHLESSKLTHGKTSYI